MLSKLLSNIANSTDSSLVKELSGKKGKVDTSREVFKSLLQSLQNDLSKDKQQLLKVGDSEGENSEEGEENKKSKILGGTFTRVVSEGDGEGKEAQTMPKKLQQKNIEAGNGDETEDSQKENKEIEVLSGDEESSKKVVSRKAKSDTEGTEKETDVTNAGKDVTNADKTAESSEKTDKSKSSNKAEKTTKQKKLQQSSQQVVEEQSKGRASSDGNDDKQSLKAETESQNVQSKEQEVSTKNTDDSKKKSSKSPNDNNSGTTRPGNVAGAEETENKHEEGQQESSQRTKSKAQQKQPVEEQLQSSAEGSKSKKSDGATKMKSKDMKLDENRDKAIPKNISDESKQDKEILNKRNLLGLKEHVKTKISGDSSEINERASSKREMVRSQNAGREVAQTQKQMRVRDSFFQQGISGGISEKGVEMKSVQAEKNRSKKSDSSYDEKQKSSLNTSKKRDQFLSRLGLTNNSTHKQEKPFEIQNFTTFSSGNSDMSLEDKKVMWEKHVDETVEATDEKETKTKNTFGSARLNQMPVANISLRKKVMPGLAKSIHQAAAEAKQNPGNWQKHNFVLDDGKKIQLSVRESKGVLQVKMGSMNMDLSKLLQQNIQQIREHLKQEFGSEIDLQFENNEQQGESQFTGDTESSERKRDYRNSFLNDGDEEMGTETVTQASSKTVRNFGYNQMEWTA